jgi:hypothetical protein
MRFATFDSAAHSGDHSRKILKFIAALMFVGLPTTTVSAQSAPGTASENSVTLYGGARFGGSVTDSTNNSSIDLKNGSSFGLAVDIGMDLGRQVEVFYSQQNTALTSGAFASTGNDLTLRNYHVGGTAFIDEIGRGVYVMGGIGGTTATPQGRGLNSETFFSGNLGVGWMVPLGRNVGFRFEARGYGIALRGSGALFCGGRSGCTVAVKGNGLFYGEVLAGVAARF